MCYNFYMSSIIGNYDISLAESGCAPGSGKYGALLHLPGDISPVFPYLNAELADAIYDHENKIIIWRTEERAYACRPFEIKMARVENLAQAKPLAAELVSWINRVWDERESITPRHAERRRPPVIELYKQLPGTNCAQCGYATCLAFAADLQKGKTDIVKCPPLSQPEHNDKLAALRELAAIF